MGINQQKDHQNQLGLIDHKLEAINRLMESLCHKQNNSENVLFYILCENFNSDFRKIKKLLETALFEDQLSNQHKTEMLYSLALLLVKNYDEFKETLHTVLQNYFYSMDGNDARYAEIEQNCLEAIDDFLSHYSWDDSVEFRNTTCQKVGHLIGDMIHTYPDIMQQITANAETKNKIEKLLHFYHKKRKTSPELPLNKQQSLPPNVHLSSALHLSSSGNDMLTEDISNALTRLKTSFGVNLFLASHALTDFTHNLHHRFQLGYSDLQMAQKAHTILLEGESLLAQCSEWFVTQEESALCQDICELFSFSQTIKSYLDQLIEFEQCINAQASTSASASEDMGIDNISKILASLLKAIDKTNAAAMSELYWYADCQTPSNTHQVNQLLAKIGEKFAAMQQAQPQEEATLLQPQTAAPAQIDYVEARRKLDTIQSLLGGLHHGQTSRDISHHHAARQLSHALRQNGEYLRAAFADEHKEIEDEHINSFITQYKQDETEEYVESSLKQLKKIRGKIGLYLSHHQTSFMLRFVDEMNTVLNQAQVRTPKEKIELARQIDQLAKNWRNNLWLIKANFDRYGYESEHACYSMDHKVRSNLVPLVPELMKEIERFIQTKIIDTPQTKAFYDTNNDVQALLIELDQLCRSIYGYENDEIGTDGHFDLDEAQSEAAVSESLIPYRELLEVLDDLNHISESLDNSYSTYLLLKGEQIKEIQDMIKGIIDPIKEIIQHDDFKYKVLTPFLFSKLFEISKKTYQLNNHFNDSAWFARHYHHPVSLENFVSKMDKLLETDMTSNFRITLSEMDALKYDLIYVKEKYPTLIEILEKKDPSLAYLIKQLDSYPKFELPFNVVPWKVRPDHFFKPKEIENNFEQLRKKYNSANQYFLSSDTSQAMTDQQVSQKDLFMNSPDGVGRLSDIFLTQSKVDEDELPTDMHFKVSKIIFENILTSQNQDEQSTFDQFSIMDKILSEHQMTLTHSEQTENYELFFTRLNFIRSVIKDIKQERRVVNILSDSEMIELPEELTNISWFHRYVKNAKGNKDNMPLEVKLPLNVLDKELTDLLGNQYHYSVFL